jgi:hypothetical protein
MAKLSIYAYYYPWYRGRESLETVTWYSHYPPALGFYYSDDPRVIQQHLMWAQDYGIDGFLVEWFGRETDDGRYVDANLHLLADRMRGFPRMRYAVFYDQAIRFGGLEFSDAEKREAFLSDMERLAADNFDHPNYWFIGDRPVVVIYVTRAAGPGYGTLLDEARVRMARAGGYAPYIIGDDVWWNRDLTNIDYLDGVTAFNLHNNNRVGRVNGEMRPFIDEAVELYRYWQRFSLRADTGFFPGVGHAYNDEAVRSNLPILPTWQEGGMPAYREDMVYAIEQMVTILRSRNPIVEIHGLAPVFINSFNEWPERSAVEPSAVIGVYNDLNFFAADRRLLLPGHGYRYLEGIRDAKLQVGDIVSDL